jgi:hypothetical protein
VANTRPQNRSSPSLEGVAGWNPVVRFPRGVTIREPASVVAVAASRMNAPLLAALHDPLNARLSYAEPGSGYS